MPSSRGLLCSARNTPALCVATGLLFLFTMHGNAQVVIKERIEINTNASSNTPANGITDDPSLGPLYLRYGGNVLLRYTGVSPYTDGWHRWSFQEASAGFLSRGDRHGGAIPDSVTLGPFQQWHRFDLSIVDSTVGNVTLPADGNAILGDPSSPTSPSTVFFLLPGDTSIGGFDHYEWVANLTLESGYEHMPPPEVLAALGNPYVPSATLVSPAKGEAILVGAYANADGALYTELPHDSLIAANVRTIVGDTLHLGRVDSGSTYRFYIRSSKPLVSGINLYPNNSSGGERTANGDIRLGSLDFEDGTDLDFGDAGVSFEIVPDRVGGIPGPVLVEASRTEASLGDTVTFHVRGRADDGTLVEYPDTMRFSVSLVRGASYGTLVSQEGDEEGDELYWTLNGFTLVVADTMSLEEIEIGVGAGPNISVPARPALSHGVKGGPIQREKGPKHLDARSKTPMLRVGGNDVKGEGGIRRASIQDEPIGGLGFASVMVKNHTILLGETKYYQARIDSQATGKLIIEGLSEPTANDNWITSAAIWGDSSLQVVSGGKLGVYWDKKVAAVYTTGAQEPVMSDLPSGLIRLIGRYWDRDSTYRVRLRTATYQGRSGEITIAVERPDSLGSTHTMVTGPTRVNSVDSTWNLDSLIIEHAGREGILPQIIKGIMEKESMSFHPSYRYEPFADMQTVHNVPTWFDSTHRYWIRSATQLGNPGIPLHNNVHLATGGVIQEYPGYQNAWSYYSNYDSSLYAKKHYKLMKDQWKGYFESHLDSLLRTGVTRSLAMLQGRILADTSYVHFLQDSIGIIGMLTTVAQTRIAASYGLMQLTYYGGVMGFKEEVEESRGRSEIEKAEWRRYRYPQNNVDHLPEHINIPPINLRYGVLHLRGKIRKGLRATLFTADTWPQGLEVGYWRGLKRYNGGDGYPNPVFGFAQDYVPRKKK